MPSAFDAEFLSVAVPDIESTFGETVTLIDSNGRAYALTAVVAHDQSSQEEQRHRRQRVDRCQVWTAEGERESGEPVSIAHDEGRIVVETGLALRVAYDGLDQLWDFAETIGRSGGMIGLRFQRRQTEETGDLTPRMG